MFSLFAVNKQLNDKERVAAALENPNLLDMVEECLSPTFDWGLNISQHHAIDVPNSRKLVGPLWSSLLSFENWDALAVAGGVHEFWLSTPLIYCVITFFFPWTALVLVIFLSEGKRCNQVLCCSFQSVVDATAFCGCIVYTHTINST